MSSNTTTTTDLLSKVHQYVADHLEHAQLLGTRGAFIHECGELGFPIVNQSTNSKPQPTNPIPGKIKSILFQVFDDTNYERFFEVWDTLPHTYGSKTHSKLNFRLHVHFNCRSVMVNRMTLLECMQNIRQFFDREGSFLASEQEYIHFFALPFVMEPREHPSFKALFELSNWMRLRSDLQAYLEELRERSAHDSELSKIVEAHFNSQNPDNGKLKNLENELENTRLTYSQLLHNHNKLRGDHHKLISVTKELTTALEMAVKSSGNGKKSNQHFNWSSIVLRCGKIYPELVSNFDKSERASTAVGNYHSHQQELLHRPNLPAMAMEDQPVSKVNQVTSINSEKSSSRPKSSPIDHQRLLVLSTNHATSPPQNLCAPSQSKALVPRQHPPTPNRLNFWMIQSQIASKINRRTLLLLQALRWLLTKSGQCERKVFLNSYLNHDIFGLRKPQSNVVGLISKESSEVEEHSSFQQSVVRLMNAMASVKSGRDYLGNYTEIVTTLINSLLHLSQTLDQLTVDMIVATLQKLSLKYLVRRQMIESGMLEWLIDHLKQFLSQNAENISTYGLEYSTALFMNLCLHRSGKLRCLPMAQKVLSTFLQLLSSANKRKILPYVNGTLYSLLTNPKIAASARNLQIAEKIKLALAAPSSNDPEMGEFDDEAKQQISFVLQQYEESSSGSGSSSTDSNSCTSLASSICDDGYEEDEESHDEDVDIEEEIDLYDPVSARDEELSGNALLWSSYIVQEVDMKESSIIEVNEDEEEETESPPEDSLDDEPDVKEKILEEDIIGSSSSSGMIERRNSRKSSEEDLPRKPCSFFICTSPPLPNLAAPSITSDISSEDANSNNINNINSISQDQEEISVPNNNNNKNNNSDTDEGVVLVMDKDGNEEKEISPPPPPILQCPPPPVHTLCAVKEPSKRLPNRPGHLKKRSRSSARRSSTTSSSSGDGSARGPRKKTEKTRSSPTRTELPKIGPPTQQQNVQQQQQQLLQELVPNNSKESTSTTTNVTHTLLNRVAAALPLLPPLPKEGGIDHTKGSHHVTEWKDEKITMADEKMEGNQYSPPPSPRKRWKKLDPMTNTPPALKSLP